MLDATTTDPAAITPEPHRELLPHELASVSGGKPKDMFKPSANSVMLYDNGAWIYCDYGFNGACCSQLPSAADTGVGS